MDNASKLVEIDHVKGVEIDPVREKLIELLDYVTEKFRFDAWENTDKIADYLISHGVTVIPITGIGDMSDGYHTFNELYHHRAMLFSVICNTMPEKAWKAKKHDDGTMYDGMFIVGIETPEGQATYHYDIEPYWEMFDVKELEYAPMWDGHTPDIAIRRIAMLGFNGVNVPDNNVGHMTNADRCVCCGAEIPEGRQVCPECMEKGKDKPCVWCKAEYTIIDDDFGQPVHPSKVKFCFNCGRRLR